MDKVEKSGKEILMMIFLAITIQWAMSESVNSTGKFRTSAHGKPVFYP